jgi:hypothetical protein
MMLASSQCNIVRRPAAPADRISFTNEEDFQGEPLVVQHGHVGRTDWVWIADDHVQDHIGNRLLPDQPGRFGQRRSQIGVGCLADKVADRCDAAGEGGARSRGVIVGTLRRCRRPYWCEVNMWIDAAWKHQHPFRVDDASARRRGQIPANFSDRTATHADVAFTPANRGHNEPIAHDELRRRLSPHARNQREYRPQEHPSRHVRSAPNKNRISFESREDSGSSSTPAS